MTAQDVSPAEIGAKKNQRRPVKWHIVYYLLAAFDVLAISGSLYLSHQVLGIFRSSVEVNQVWAEKLAGLSDIAAASGSVNAPGNDVFDSHDVAKEAARQAEALIVFRQRLEAFRQTLHAIRRRLELLVNLPSQSVDKLMLQTSARDLARS